MNEQNKQSEHLHVTGFFLENKIHYMACLSKVCVKMFQGYAIKIGLETCNENLFENLSFK